MINKVVKKNKFLLDRRSLEILLAQEVLKNNKIAYFASDDSSLNLLKRNLLRINNKFNIIEFPSFDCSFFSNLSPTSSNKSNRIKALYNLIFENCDNTIFLSSLDAITTNTLHYNFVKSFNLILNLKTPSSYTEILNYIEKAGYEKVDFVHNKGEFAIRGEIIDIFSPIYEFPLRILFDFEKVESLNLFSTENQLSFKAIDLYKISLSSEFQFNNENIVCFRRLFRKLKITNKNDYYKSISEKNILPASEQFFPILNENYDSIFKYLKKFNFYFDQDFQVDFKKILNDKINSNNELKNLEKIGSNFFFSHDELMISVKERNYLLSNNFLEKQDKEVKIFSSKFDFKNDKIKNQNKILDLLKNQELKIFCVTSKINEKKISNLLNSQNVSFKKISNINFHILKNSKFRIFIFDYVIDSSFVINSIDFNRLYFISDQDFYDKTYKKAVSRPIKEENLIDDYSSLKIGDYIVHNDHGIGKYNGLKSKIFNNITYEFLELIYHGDDKLLIPVENLSLISKYGQGEISVALDRLGLQNWQQRKANVKKRIKEIAETLIKTAAERKLQKGEVLIAKTFEYEKFSSEFEFTETSDQLKSIQQIENDLSSGKPMDRLICGDVGFGKTEIAMRAAFITVSSGYQVALICPKLLLVNQHFINFRKRFNNFNYQINKISRAENIKEKELIKNNLKLGNLDILIGTHAILSNDISFKKLGLIIIDEEQSFGVEQKEKLKKLKPNCHILTLTATPIPRTLQSSIFQLKNISLIKTPPLSRLNIKTYLMLKDEIQIKKIIEAEIRRDGQIFYVCPRISDLEFVKQNIKNFLPDLKFDVIHGRLSSKEVDESYNRFFKKESNLLLSTAMIESGLDISNVNTIIIDKPNLFGLSQLYQLRGRVGRSSRQAYAYLILEDFKSIGENSLKKLKIISKIKALGSGFSIASSDLDLRGGGNIVGSEQSGHIKEVGLELYYKMLKDTVNELKNNKKVDSNWTPSIKLGFPISIPDDYIEDLDLRLNLYRKISNINNIEDLEEMLLTLKDRFGKIPSSLKNLFHIIEIRIEAKKLSIKKIDYSNKGFVLEFKNDSMMDVDKLIRLVKRNPDFLKLMPGSKLFYKNTNDKDVDKIRDLKKILHTISKN